MKFESPMYLFYILLIKHTKLEKLPKKYQIKYLKFAIDIRTLLTLKF